MSKLLRRYCIITTFMILALLPVACSSSNTAPTEPDSGILELDPSLHLITDIHESLTRISNESIGEAEYRDTWELTEAGKQQLLNGATLDFRVLVIRTLEAPQCSFRVHIPGSDTWVSLFDCGDTHPSYEAIDYYWTVWDRAGFPPAYDTFDNTHLTIEYSHAIPEVIRIVEVRTEALGPVLPMGAVHCASTVENAVIHVRWPNQFYIYEDNTIQSIHEGGGALPFTVTNGHAWWLVTDPEDVQYLRWVNLSTGDSDEKSGFPCPVSGLAGLDTQLMVGATSDTTWLQHDFYLFSIPQILAGASLSAALVDSISLAQGIFLWGTLPFTQRVFGITDQDMSGGLEELQIGIWDTVTMSITCSTVPCSWDDLLGMTETQSDRFIGIKRIHKQAIGWGGGSWTGSNYISIEPRLFCYPLQSQQSNSGH